MGGGPDIRPFPCRSSGMFIGLPPNGDEPSPGPMSESSATVLQLRLNSKQGTFLGLSFLLAANVIF